MIYKKFTKQFFYYGLIGLSALFLELLLFYFLIQYFNIIFSNSLSLVISIFYSYYMNFRYNFKNINNFFYGALKFYVTCISGLIISNCIIYLLLNYTDSVLLVKLISVPPVVFFQFLVNYFWTFKKKN